MTREIEVKKWSREVDCIVRNKLIKGFSDVSAIFDLLMFEAMEHSNLKYCHFSRVFQSTRINPMQNSG